MAFQGKRDFGRTGFRKGGGQRSFGKGNFDRGGRTGRPSRDTDRERELFKATCSSCGKPCEVPFRPSGDRPVLCKECFAERGDFPGKGTKRDTGVYRAKNAETKSSEGVTHMIEMKRHLEVIEQKLDTIIKNIEKKDLASVVEQVSKKEDKKPRRKTKKEEKES